MDILHNKAYIKQARKENFPVASLLIPPQIRQAIMVCYEFARSIDHIADDPALSAEQKMGCFDEYRQGLDAIAEQQSVSVPLFMALKHIVARHELPLTPLYALLNTLEQDIVFKQPDNFADLMHYCTGYANTIGDIFLNLFGQHDPQLKRQSDAICSALQLIDCWQDIVDDEQQGRLYLPREDMLHFQISRTEIQQKQFTSQWQACMQCQLQRTHALLIEGAPLADHITGRIGWEIRMMVLGGLALIHRMAAQHGNPFTTVARLRRWDWIKIALNSFRYQTIIQQEKNKTIDCS